MVALSDAVAYWKAIDYSGAGNLLDGSGNSHDAVDQGALTFNSGAQPYFDGFSSANHFLVADHADLEVNGDLTVVFVGYGTPSADRATITKQTLGTGAALGWSMWIGTTTAKVRVSDGAVAAPDSQTAPVDDTIFSFAMVRDDSADRLTAVVNGTGLQSAESLATDLSGNGANVLIGRWSGVALPYQGRFYGAAIFKSVLTYAETDQIGTELLTTPVVVEATRRIMRSPRYGITRMVGR